MKDNMTQEEILERLYFILEREFSRKNLPDRKQAILSEEMNDLIKKLEDGRKKDRFLEKLHGRYRYGVLFNDTGIKDFTGFGGHFH